MTTAMIASQTRTDSATPLSTLRKNVDYWNARYLPLTFAERIEQFYKDFGNKKILLTSSFGTSSMLLLYWVSQSKQDQVVHFVDTTFHFPETLAYKQEVSTALNLNVIDIKPDHWENRLSKKGHLWSEDVDKCCAINKISPLNPYKWSNDFWITGRMGFQTSERSSLEIFEITKDIIKFNPLVDMTEGEFLYYFGYYKLQAHPLKALGYDSVGCFHCTKAGKGRTGRWVGMDKTECGLH